MQFARFLSSETSQKCYQDSRGINKWSFSEEPITEHWFAVLKDFQNMFFRSGTEKRHILKLIMSSPEEFGHGYIICVWLGCLPEDNHQCQMHHVRKSCPLEVVTDCYTRKFMLFDLDSLEWSWTCGRWVKWLCHLIV